MASAPADDFLVDHLARAPVLAVLRGLDSAAAVGVAEACWEAGVELVEVSLTADPDLVVVGAVCQRASELGHVAGAGTVCTADQVRAAVRAGARFAVAPGLDSGAVEAAQATALPYLPGVSTPSETQAALALGCRTLKLFPAAALGADWLRALAGPFPSARFVAVGGITAANASAFLAAGAIGVAIGSGLEPDNLRGLVTELRAQIASQPK